MSDVRRAGMTDVAAAIIGAAVGAVVVGVAWEDSFLDEDSRRWAIVAVIAVAALVGVCLPRLETLLPWPGASTVALLFPLAAIYGCVPETSQLPPIAVLVVAIAVRQFVRRGAQSLASNSLATTLVLWGGVYGATGQARAVVGGLFAFWPIIVLVAVATLRPTFANASAAARIFVFGVGAAAALIVSRSGALQPGRRAAARDAAIAAAASLLVAVFVARSSTHARRARPWS